MNAELLVRLNRARNHREASAARTAPRCSRRQTLQLAAAQRAAATGRRREATQHRQRLRTHLPAITGRAPEAARLAALVEVASTAQDWIDLLLQRARRRLAARRGALAE